MGQYYLFASFIFALVCAAGVVFKLLFSDAKKQVRLLEEREKEILKTYNAVETIMEEFQDQAKATTDELARKEQEYREKMKIIEAMQVTAPPANIAVPVPPDIPQRPQPPEDTRIKAATEIIERAEKYVIHGPEQTAQTEKAAPLLQEPPQPPITVVSPKVAQAAYASLPQKAIADFETAQEKNGQAKTPVFQRFFDDAAEETPPPVQYTPAPAPINGGSKKEAILALSKDGKTDVEIASQLGITRNEVQLVIGLSN